MRLLFVIISLFTLAATSIPAKASKRWMMNGRAQGTTYSIIYYAPDSIVVQSEIDSIIRVIDKSMSLYMDSSLITLFNKPDRESIQMDKHMTNVVKKSFKINRQSNGLFDISIKPLVDLWGFGENGDQGLPDSSRIQQTLRYVGQDRFLSIKGNVLSKKNNLVSIDLNGIAQGYTVDVLASYLSEKGIRSFLVELGGEIVAKGDKPDNTPYQVAINRPYEEASLGEYIVKLKDKSITTSGNYERKKIVNNAIVSHHINPKTGYPFRSNNISVTVLADRAIDADAWDNVFMGMEAQEAVKLANKLKKIEIYMVYQDGSDFKELFSKGFKQYIN